MARPKSDDSRLLTPAELMVMQVLWKQNSATASQVQEILNEQSEKDFAYTTVSTMLRVLEKKNAVVSQKQAQKQGQKQGRGHVYQPLIKQAEYQITATRELINDLYSGQPTLLVKNLLGQAALSEKDVAELRELLQQSEL